MTTETQGEKPMHAAVDPYTGIPVDPFLGAAPHDDDEFEADPKSRGDFVGEEAAPPPVEEAKPAEEPQAEATETPVTEGEVAAEAKPEGEEDKEPHHSQEQERDEKGRWIPKDRFDQVNERRKAAERELLQLKGQQQAVQQAGQQTYDFDAAEERYMDAVLDGNKDDAKAIRREIDAARREVLRSEFQELARETIGVTKVRETVDQVVDTAVAAYAVLDDTSEEYNPEIVEEVDAMYAGYLSKSMNPVAALKRAIDNAAKVHGLVDRTAAPPPEPEKPAAKPRQSVAQKIAAANAQPPSAAGVGSPGAKPEPTVEELSDEEYDALPESTKAKLRGDFRIPTG